MSSIFFTRAKQFIEQFCGFKKSQTGQFPFLAFLEIELSSNISKLNRTEEYETGKNVAIM
jgi:hypothetical protein